MIVMRKYVLLLLFPIALIADPADGFQVFVSSIGGTTATLEVSGNDTIETVKEKYQAIKGIAPERQSLYFSGLELINGRTLSDFNVQKEALLEVLFNPLNPSLEGPLSWDGSEALVVEFTNGFTEPQVSQYKLQGSLDLAQIDPLTPVTVRLETPFFPLESFDPTADYTWTIIDATEGGIFGFTSDRFKIETDGFANEFDGSWSVSEGSLALHYTPIPEPSHYLWILGILGYFVASRRR